MHAQSIADIFRGLDRELWIVTATDGRQRGGLVATTVVCVSIVPDLPRVLVSVARQHQTWTLIEASAAFGLHLIAPEQIDLVWRFGLLSGRDVDKFDGLVCTAGATGSPILAAAPAWLDCRVESRMETGDRTVYLAEVLDGGARRNVAPLTMHRLLELAPDDRKRQLREQLQADAAVDAAAIRNWRTTRGGGTP